MSGKAAWGVGLSQDDLMECDTVLVVDDQDKVVGSASKKDSHVFNAANPHGILHRAFSVFLFDESDGRLLLHQRAADKITFPNVSTHLS
jgi:isopentenyl-diphosphate delta-isomerase type 1